MGGVYECSYHPLFDCGPEFYTWNTNNLQTITARFPVHVAVQMVNIIIFFPTRTRMQIRISYQKMLEDNLVQTQLEDILLLFDRGNQNYTSLFLSDIVEVDIGISTSSEIVMRIIFCASQG